MSRSMVRRRFESQQMLTATRQPNRLRRAGLVAVGRAAVEALEQRLVFSTLVVNTVADDTTSDNFLSLREAVLLIENGGDANAALSRTLTTAEQAQIDVGLDPFGTNDLIGFDGSINNNGSIDFASAMTVTTTFTIDGGASMTLTGGSSQATHRAFDVGSTGNLTLRGLDVTNFSHRGTTSSSPTVGFGGAIYVNGGALTLDNVSLTNNSAIGGMDNDMFGGAGAAGRGGAIYNNAGTVSITGGSLSNNAATGGDNAYDDYYTEGAGEGGAIYSAGGTLTISDASFESNVASMGTASGGAIYQTSGTFTFDVEGTTLVSNAATAGEIGSDDGGQARGGAIYSSGGTATVTLTDVTATNNTATGGDGSMGVAGAAAGGAIYLDQGTIVVADSTVSSNSATAGADYMGYGGAEASGGAIYMNDATLTLTDSTLSSNTVTSTSTATAAGGAVYVADSASSVTVNGGTLSGNTATGGTNYMSSGDGNGVGGAIYARGTLNVTDTTLTNNAASRGHAKGGAIYSDQAAITLALTNKSVTGNTVTGRYGASSTAGTGYGGAIYAYLGSGTLSFTDATISNNVANGGTSYMSYNGGAASGGAVYAEGANLAVTVTDSTVSSNSANAGTISMSGTAGAGAGGAFYTSLASLTITDTALTSNAATKGAAKGGAIYVAGGAFSLSQTGVDITSNTATGGTYSAGTAQGGAIYVASSTGSMSFDDVEVTGNSATGGSPYMSGTGGAGHGGAIYTTGSALTTTFVDSVLSTNSATGSYGGWARGGALYIDDGSVSFTDTTVASNTATGATASMSGNGGSAYGGAIYANGSNTAVNVTTSTFSANTAKSGAGYFSSNAGDAFGGAFYVGSGDLDVVNSTIANNVASVAVGGSGGSRYGGAIYASDAAIDIDFTTVSGNTAAGGGVGLYVSSSGSAVVDITNSIFGQSSNSVTDIAYSGTVATTGSHNLIRNTAVTGLGNVSNADPKLATLDDHGGPTHTMTLIAYSPALNAAGATVLTLDQRGGARVAAGQADIGAIESAGVGPLITSANTVNFAPNVASTFTFTTSGSGTITLSDNGTLPTGVTFTDNGDGTATLAGTPTDLGSFPLTITAANGFPSDATQSFTLSVTGAPVISSADHATFTVGSAGTFTVTTIASPTATLTPSNAMPVGLTFTDNGDGTATIAGTPATGTGDEYVFTVTAANGNAPDATQTFTLTINQAPAIVSSNVATFTIGTAGTFTFTTTGFPTAALSHAGTLPSGVTFTDNGDGTATLAGTPADATEGDYAIDVTAHNGIGTDATLTFTLTVDKLPTTLTAIASGANRAVEVYNPDGTERFTIEEPLGTKKVELRLGYGDITGDGVDDVVVAAGPNGRGQVAIFDGVTGDKVADFLAFTSKFTPGLYITTGDVDNDGRADIIVGQGKGTRSSVKIFSGADQSEIAYFRAFDGNYGVRVAASDLDGDGHAEVIATQGSGGGRTTVRVFDGHDLANGTTTIDATYRPFGDRYTGSANIATGDVNADGTADIIVAKATGKNPTISVFDGTNHAPLTSFTTPATKDGARVSSSDIDGDGHADLIVGAIVARTFVVKIFSGLDNSVLDTYETELKGQMFVA